MLTKRQKKFVSLMTRLRLFVIHEGVFLTWVHGRWGFDWLVDRLLKSQVVDDLHHAPACPANHYHHTRLVFLPCICGAKALLRTIPGFTTDDDLRRVAGVYDSSGKAGAIHHFRFRERDLLELLRHIQSNAQRFEMRQSATKGGAHS